MLALPRERKKNCVPNAAVVEAGSAGVRVPGSRRSSILYSLVSPELVPFGILNLFNPSTPFRVSRPGAGHCDAFVAKPTQWDPI